MTAPNVDQNEINQFSAHAGKWWDETGPHKALHAINPTRVSFIASQTTLTGAKGLDIGCGGGLVAEALTQHGAHMTAIDMDATAIEVAKAHAEKSELTIDYQVNTAEVLAQTQAGKFDFVTCLEMLEHVPDPKAIIQACAVLCKPNGKLFFSTLNRNPASYLGAIIGAEYLLGLVPKGTHQYQRFIKPSELNAWAGTAGLDLVQQRGMHYNPFTQNCKLTDKMPVNYIACYTQN